MAKAKPSPFSKSLFQFLGELALHNDREWFQKNKDRYESDVREPALELVRMMAPHLAKISPQLIASDKKVGGSLMRIHRDIRFSKDKTPYKTNVGIRFGHSAGKDVHAPGLYVHIEIDECFLGAGMWRPEAQALLAVRKAIVGNPAAWKRARDNAKFRKLWDIGGDSLSRPPKGFPADHEMLEDLKRKDHIAVANIKASQVTRAGFVEKVVEAFKAAKPYLAWQAKALDLKL